MRRTHCERQKHKSWLLCAAHGVAPALALAEALCMDARLDFIGCVLPGPDLVTSLRLRTPCLLLIDAPPPLTAGHRGYFTEAIITEALAAQHELIVIVLARGINPQYGRRMLEYGAHGCIDAGLPHQAIITALHHALAGDLVLELVPSHG
jgi:hypothetical protein